MSLEIKTSRDLGPQLNDNSHRMISQDGAYSIPLGEKTLWFFGDTMIGKRVPGESLWYPGGKPVGHRDMTGMGSIERMINNTALVLDKCNGAEGMKDYRYICDTDGGLKQLVPYLDDEHSDWVRVWCLHGCQLGEKIYLYYITVTMLEEGPFPVNFKLRGSGLAVGSAKDWNFERIVQEGSTLWWGEDDPQFASVVLPVKPERMVYLYGVKSNEQGVQQCYLARVAEDEIESLESHEYLCSSSPTWRKSIAEAIPLMEGMPNEMSVSYNEYMKCYLAVHSMDLSGNIVGRTAVQPWGPWSDPEVLWSVPCRHAKRLPYPPLIYAAKEHPALADNGGRVLYITYIDFEEYYPHMIEVTLA